jgi:hypothetical protein
LFFFNWCVGSQGEKEEDEDDDIPSDRKLPKSTLLSKINATTIKSVLELLCDESVSQKLNLTPSKVCDESVRHLHQKYIRTSV